MINTDRLRGIIAERNTSQAKIAKRIGISPTSFYNKMKARKFDSDEIESMIILLSIEDPIAVFFTNVGTLNAPISKPA